MKKLLFLLLALPLLGLAVSCDDDDNLPKVDITFSYTNGTVVGSQVYVVKPDTLYIDGISVKAVNTDHEATIAGLVTYYVDGRMPGLVASPYERIPIVTEGLSIGQHNLSVTMNVAEEGCALASAVAGVRFNVVADSTDIPSAASGYSNQMPVEYTLK